MGRMSVRNKLTFVLLAMGVLPLAIFAAAFSSVLRDHVESDAGRMSRAMLLVIGSEVSARAIDSPKQDIPSFLLLLGRETDPARIRDVMRAMLAPRPEYVMLALLDEAGTVVASYPEEWFPPGSSYSPRATDAAPGSVAFSPPFESEALERPLVEVSYGNGNQTLVAGLNLEWLSAKLFLVSGSGSDVLGIVSSDGRIIASSSPSLMREGAAVEARLLGAGLAEAEMDGTDYIVSSAPIPGSPWRAVYFMWRDAAMAPLRDFALRLAIIVAASLAASVVIAYVSWKSIAEPLAALNRKIRKISDGRYDERVRGEFSPEFVEIGEAMNVMAASIESRDRELAKSELRYRRMFERMDIPVLLLDPESLAVEDANSAALSFYGYGPDEIRALGMRDIDAEGPAGEEHRDRTSFQAKHRLKSGETRDVQVFVSPTDAGDSYFLYCVIIDVTERRLATERLETALAEKTLLLREVYHRVKNNLQIISSLLNIQVNSTTDKAIMDALRGTQDRVFAMSLAHELVYQMPNLSSISAGEYAGRLLDYLADQYGILRDGLRLGFEDLELELERAVPFGLILSELGSNAFKYAAPARGGGVRAELRNAGDETMELVVEDDGPGLPEGAEAGGSLGMTLIAGLAEQLGGKATWTRSASGGTRATVTFLRRPAARRAAGGTGA